MAVRPAPAERLRGRSRVLAAALCTALTLGAGGAQAGLFSDDDARRQIYDLREQLRILNERMAALEQTVQRLEGANPAVLDLSAQMEALRGEVNDLRGRAEVQAHTLDEGRDRQKNLYLDLDTRLRRLESGQSASPAGSDGGPPAGGAQGGAVPGPYESPAESGPSAATPGGGENAAYSAALDRFRASDYRAAITAFERFLQQYPESSLAPSAQYWIGNAHFSLGQYRAAIGAQRALLANYPQSNKAPDALLNIATSQGELGDDAGARKTLKRLVADYPSSSAAQIARKRLR